MNDMEMNLQKYLSFVKTAECGNFTKAAELLNYSQASISRMISDLEKEWNVSLLERSAGGVRITSDGMKLLPYAKNLVAEFEKLQYGNRRSERSAFRPNPNRYFFKCGNPLAAKYH